MIKKIIILISILWSLLYFSGFAFASDASALADVPIKHWSYEAVMYLAQNGIIDGYDEKTFQGNKIMTRYEMAQVVAKALLKQDKANVIQKAVIDKLAAEYAMEITKIEQLDTRLTTVKENQPNIKLNGLFLFQQKTKNRDSGIGSWSATQYNMRLNGTANVDKDATVGFRFVGLGPTNSFKATTAYYGGQVPASPQIDRIFVTTKLFDGVKARLGRQAPVVDQEDVIIDSGFFSYDGLRLNWKWDRLEFDVMKGNFARGVTGYAFDNHLSSEFSTIDISGIRASSKINKVDWAIGTVEFHSKVSDQNVMNYAYSSLKYLAADNLGLTAEFGKNTKATTGGQFWLAKATIGDQALKKKGNSNINLQYLSSENNGINYTYTAQDGLDEGMSYGVNTVNINYQYAFSGNKIGKLEWCRAKAQDADATTTANQSYDYFKAVMLVKF